MRAPRVSLFVVWLAVGCVEGRASEPEPGPEAAVAVAVYGDGPDALFAPPARSKGRPKPPPWGVAGFRVEPAVEEALSVGLEPGELGAAFARALVAQLSSLGDEASTEEMLEHRRSADAGVRYRVDGGLVRLEGSRGLAGWVKLQRGRGDRLEPVHTGGFVVTTDTAPENPGQVRRFLDEAARGLAERLQSHFPRGWLLSTL